MIHEIQAPEYVPAIFSSSCPGYEEQSKPLVTVLGVADWRRKAATGSISLGSESFCFHLEEEQEEGARKLLTFFSSTDLDTLPLVT